MSVIQWIDAGEPARAANDLGEEDVVNRPLREVLTDSGLDPDADFPGFIPNTSSPVITGNLTVTGNLAVGGNVTVGGNVSITGNLSVSGTAPFVKKSGDTMTGTLILTPVSGVGLNITTGGATVVGNVTITGDITHVGNFGITGNLTVSGTINSQTISAAAFFTGTVTVATGLTISAGGATITGDSGITGALTVTGTINLQTISAAATFTGTVTIATGLTVSTGGAAITGNSSVTGTLNVTSDFTVATSKFIVLAASGNTTVAGTLSVTSDLTVNTSKFIVTASSGNTTIAGTLGVTGVTTISNSFYVNPPDPPGSTGTASFYIQYWVGSGEFGGGMFLANNSSNSATYNTAYGNATGASGAQTHMIYYNGAAWYSAIKFSNVAGGGATRGTFDLMQAGGTVRIGNTATATVTLGNSTTLTVGGATTLSSTLAVTGDTVIGVDASAGRALSINAAVATNRDLIWKTASISRWILRTNNTSESGSNAGSDFNISSRDDSGTQIDVPLTITRAAGGNFAIARPITGSSTITMTGNYVSTAGLIKLGTAPGTGGAINVDSSSYSNVGLSVTDGTRTFQLQVGSSSGISFGSTTSHALFLMSGNIVRWQLDTTASTSTLTSFQATARIVMGSTNGIAFRDSTNANDRFVINNAGSSAQLFDGTNSVQLFTSAATGELLAGGGIGGFVSGKSTIVKTTGAGTTSAIQGIYFDGTQTRSAWEVTNVASGFGNLELMKSGGIVRFQSNVAIPAAGAVTSHIRFSSTSGFGFYWGSGAPTVTAAKGSIYLRSDGSGINDRAYINTDGSTTWTAMVTVA